jgi:peptide/nickel transport system permease protein
VLPNVLNAAVSLGGLLFVGIIGGSVVVENVFAWPGLGTLLVQSIPALDYPVIQGATLLLGLIVVLLNTVVDVVRALVDPQAAVGGP